MLCSSDTSDTPKLHSDSNYFVFPFSTACSNMSSPHYLEEDRRRPMFLGQERSDPRYFVESCHSKGLYQVGNCVNDIPEDTPPETPKPSSASVSVCILPREDLNLHPVNKQDKTLQQSGLMRRVRESDEWQRVVPSGSRTTTCQRHPLPQRLHLLLSVWFELRQTGGRHFPLYFAYLCI